MKKLLRVFLKAALIAAIEHRFLGGVDGGEQGDRLGRGRADAQMNGGGGEHGVAHRMQARRRGIGGAGGVQRERLGGGDAAKLIFLYRFIMK